MHSQNADPQPALACVLKCSPVLPSPSQAPLPFSSGLSYLQRSLHFWLIAKCTPCRMHQCDRPWQPKEQIWGRRAREWSEASGVISPVIPSPSVLFLSSIRQISACGLSLKELCHVHYGAHPNECMSTDWNSERTWSGWRKYLLQVGM